MAQPLSPEEQARITQTIVVRCANHHHPITWSSRRDMPVPCPACGRIAQPTPLKPEIAP